MKTIHFFFVLFTFFLMSDRIVFSETTSEEGDCGDCSPVTPPIIRDPIGSCQGNSTAIPLPIPGDVQMPECFTVGLQVNARLTGCFLEGTLIRLANNSLKPIEHLDHSDRVWNPFRKEGLLIKRKVFGLEKDPLIRIHAGNSKLVVTENHPMISRTGVVAAKTLRVGDQLFSEKGWQEISHLDSMKTDRNVWNLELSVAGHSVKDHSVAANGIVTGDLLIQERLEREVKVPGKADFDNHRVIP